jgi:hypothetical protein
MTPLVHRQFTVDYVEKDPATWTAIARLQDDVHDITLRADVAVPALVVQDVQLTFTRAPLPECQRVLARAATLRGLHLDGDAGRVFRAEFLGPHGCSNVMLLLGLALPPLRFYWPFLEARRRGAQLDEGDACLAHTTRNHAGEVPAAAPGRHCPPPGNPC